METWESEEAVSVHVFKSPWQAWLLIIVLLRAWKSEKGIWIGIAIAGVAWVLYAIEEWLQQRKHRKTSN